MRADEKTIQQGYVQWVYRLLERRLVELAEMETFGTPHTKWKKERIEQLRIALADGSLVIGCLDMVDGESWYIGNSHVDGVGSAEAVLVDWRADLAQSFYQADRSDSMGVGRRLSFRMRRRILESLSEDVLTRGFKLPDSEIVVATPPTDSSSRPALPTVQRQDPAPDESATDDDTGMPPDGWGRAIDLIIEEIDSERTGHMQKIISTIQADQDRLIRRATERVTVVQGGPGTGKTVVGLHRAAWVLYKLGKRRLSDRSVLVVGPNRAFVDYIGDVLLQLGEKGTHLSLADLALLDLPDSERSRFAKATVADDRVQRIKGDSRMVGFVREAVWSHAEPTALELPLGSVAASLTKTDVAKMLARYRTADLAYEPARQRLTNEVLHALHADADQRATRQGGGGVGTFEQFSETARPLLQRLKWIDTVLPVLVPRLVVQRALSDQPFFERIAKRHLTQTQRGVLAPPAKARRLSWTESDLPLVAEAAFVITGSARRFGHVVVDEAQDLSPMQWRLVARRSTAQSLTILGDLAQATSVWAPESWSAALAAASLDESASVSELNVGYRVPKPIMELAGRLLAGIAPVSIPLSIRSGTDPLAYTVRTARALPFAVADLVEKIAAGKVGVIAAADQVDMILKVLVDRGFDAGRGSSDGLGHRVTVLDPVTSKGLEFDHVVVVEPSAIAGRSAREKRRLFVALTRATRTLTIVHAKLLPAALRGAVEDSVLEVEVPAPPPRVRAPAMKSRARRSVPAEVTPDVDPSGSTASERPTASAEVVAADPAPEAVAVVEPEIEDQIVEPVPDSMREAESPTAIEAVIGRAEHDATPQPEPATHPEPEAELTPEIAIQHEASAEIAPRVADPTPGVRAHQVADVSRTEIDAGADTDIEPPPVVASAAAPYPQSAPRDWVVREVRTKLLRKVAVHASPSVVSREVARVRGTMSLIEMTAGWARVRTQGGVEGWVPTRDLRL